jgi:hypothetical protein
MAQTIIHLQRLSSYGVAFHSYTEPHLASDNELVRNILLALQPGRRERSVLPFDCVKVLLVWFDGHVQPGTTRKAAPLKPSWSGCRGMGTLRVLNEHFDDDGPLVFDAACRLGCEGIVSKRLGSPYRSGRSSHWVKVKNPNAPAVKREAEEDWGRVDLACENGPPLY